MEMLQSLLSHVVGLMQIEFSVFGFRFSLWQGFLFDIAASIIGWILGEVFLDE